MLLEDLHVASLIEHISLSAIALTSTAILFLYCTSLTLYRLYFHPLASIPGPKLAALTYWYEYYWDVTRKGSYLWKIIELHKQYGPVLRVNPNEVHISDPTFFHEIYHSKAYKTDRDAWYNLEHLGDGLAFTTDHDLHALRKQPLLSYFSMQSIRELEPRIVSVVQTMLDRMEEEQRSGSVVNLYYVFSALAMDIVSEYAFGKDGSTAMISRPDYGKEWPELARQQVQNNPFLRHFPGVLTVMKSLPERLVLQLNPGMLGFINYQKKLTEQVKRVLTPEKGDESETSIIYSLAHSDLPTAERSIHRLRDESSLLVGAGSETTAQSLTRTTFRILSDPTILTRLRAELTTAIPDPKIIPPLAQLQQLPYLHAVIEEGLRLAFPVLARSPRVFHDHTLRYAQHVLPPRGVAVSQSPYIVQSEPAIFPDPFVYRPERWLDNKALLKYQVAFGKGRRACLGSNLAYAEMYFGIAMVFRRFELELFETTVEDVTVKHDFFVGVTALDSVGVRVKVVRELP